VAVEVGLEVAGVGGGEIAVGGEVEVSAAARRAPTRSETVMAACRVVPDAPLPSCARGPPWTVDYGGQPGDPQFIFRKMNL
jgi:hypothetical protein